MDTWLVAHGVWSVLHDWGAVVWLIGVLLIGLLGGFALGVSSAWVLAPRRLKQERLRTLKCLAQILRSAEKLNADVDSHHDHLAHLKQTLQGVRSGGDLNRVQDQLLGQLQSIADANRRLEHDLVIAQFQLQERAAEIDSTRREARVDNVSGLANRRAFDEALNYYFSSFVARGEVFGVILADIDHFKRINDTFGHAAGDRVLQRVGELIQGCVRREDVVARYGGDEFALLMAGTSEEACRGSAARIRQAVGEAAWSLDEGGPPTRVTISLGIALVRLGDTPESLLARADQALYRSKSQGRNRVHAWEGEQQLVRIDG